MSEIQVMAGPQNTIGNTPLTGDGVPVSARGDRTGSLATFDAKARYADACARGLIWTSQTKSATVTVTTDISPLPANTGVPILGLYNPPGTNIDLIIVKAGFATVSGTPGGPFYWNVIAPPAAISQTPAASQPVNNRTFLKAGSVAYVMNHIAITGSPVATELRVFGGPAAVAAGAGLYGAEENVDGLIIIPPGGFAGLAAHATGTSHVVSAYITHIEWPMLT